MKIVRELNHLFCEVRLRKSGFFILENRRLQGDFLMTFQYIKESYKKNTERMFSRACSEQDNGQMKEHQFRLNIRTFFTMRVVRHCNTLHREIVDTHHTIVAASL